MSSVSYSLLICHWETKEETQAWNCSIWLTHFYIFLLIIKNSILLFNTFLLFIKNIFTLYYEEEMQSKWPVCSARQHWIYLSRLLSLWDRKGFIIQNYNRWHYDLFFKFLLKAQTNYHLKWVGRNFIWGNNLFLSALVFFSVKELHHYGQRRPT